MVEKKITCNICFKKFRRKWNLEQHQKRIHREYYAKKMAAAAGKSNADQNNVKSEPNNEPDGNNEMQ
jgi:hypothetical protein